MAQYGMLLSTKQTINASAQMELRQGLSEIHVSQIFYPYIYHNHFRSRKRPAKLVGNGEVASPGLQQRIRTSHGQRNEKLALPNQGLF
jgi:hypothetical protein